MDILKALWKEFDWFFGILIAIAVLWFFSGGIHNQSAHQGAYIKPLAPLDSGEIYGKYYAGSDKTNSEKLNLPEGPAIIIRKAEGIIENFFAKAKEASQTHTKSLLSQGISFDGVAGAKATDPSAEYIRIVSSGLAQNSIQLSGMKLTGTSFDGGITIPKAENNPIILEPGGRALISTGISPLGFSFRVNMCSGYLNETAVYVPALRNECPDGSNCKSDPTKKFTYSDCVATYRNNKNFYTKEWRIFLGQTTELWKNSQEIITLTDAHGGLIDAITY